MTGTPIGSRGSALVLAVLACLSLVAVPISAAGSIHSAGGQNPAESTIAVTDVVLARSTIGAGETAIVRVTVSNSGDTSGNEALKLTGNGKAYVQTLVRLDAGETRTISFDRTFETPGEYELAVNGVAAGTLTVTREAPPNEATTQRPTVTLNAWVLIAVLGGALTAGSIYFVRQR